MHLVQNTCLHGSNLGSFGGSRHTEHLSCWSGGSLRELEGDNQASAAMLRANPSYPRTT